MERITKWDGGVPTYNGRYAGVEPIDDMHPAWKAVHRHWRPIEIKLEVMKRLAEYEDTDMTPKEVAALKAAAGDHVLELQKAELQNRLVLLPFAVGDKLYAPGRYENGEATAIPMIIRVVSVHQYTHTPQRVYAEVEELDTGKVYVYEENQIGKWIFLTENEAIEAGKERDRKNG